MVRTRYKPNPLYKLLSVLLCSALLLNSIALPPVLYAQSTANDQDGKPAVYLPLIQSSPTAALSDKATETATVSAANTPLPTPSGAKPPYPLNHQLDGLFAVAGTPPSNYNFETAGSYVGTPPTNADLSAAVTEVGTLPTRTLRPAT